MIKIDNLKHAKIAIKNWIAVDCEPWCILGKNGSGKQYIDQLLTGQLTDYTAEKLQLPLPEKVALVSFEVQQEIYEHELKIDNSDFTNRHDIGTPAKDFLPQDKLNHPLIATFGLADKLESGYRQLSTGEGRKLLILKAILSGIDVLICDNPFDSLDERSCLALSEILAQLPNQHITVLLIMSNRQDLPTWCRNIAFIERGELEVLGELDCESTNRQLDALMTSNFDKLEWPDKINQRRDYTYENLVKLMNTSVHYNGVNVLENLNVTIKPLQHTLITGENGSGKSTLMQLITGDCTQCYSNDIEVLGFKRGSGESIWQLKQRMGIVSAEFHRQYRVNGELLTVVLSGFFDSIGLYQPPENYQIEIARQWLNMMGLLKYQHTLFKSLSYGEQRLALISRALVKSPELLILDEPTQGLDEINRHRILNFLEKLVHQKQSTLVLVSHRKDEHLDIFTQHIAL